MAKIGIIGAGTWGTALSKMLAENGHAVVLWSALKEEAEMLRTERRHPKLKDVIIPKEIEITDQIEKALRKADIAVFAVPSVYIRSTAKIAAPYLEPDTVAVSVAKGIEPGTYLSMTSVIMEECHLSKNRIVALSGPTHAEEVSVGLPTTIVAAGADLKTARFVQAAFANAYFRVYTNPDVEGVELCGALKNVIALAAGVSDGIGYGDNAKAAIITRGMAEIARLGKAMGCDERTFYGLAGIGDLIVTATSRHSRNNRAGNLMGRGFSAKEAIEQVGMVVEGINALPAAVGLSQKYDVEMPITFAVNEMVHHGEDPKTAVSLLMTREYKAE